MIQGTTRKWVKAGLYIGGATVMGWPLVEGLGVLAQGSTPKGALFAVANGYGVNPITGTVDTSRVTSAAMKLAAGGAMIYVARKL